MYCRPSRRGVSRNKKLYDVSAVDIPGRPSRRGVSRNIYVRDFEDYMYLVAPPAGA